MVKWKFGLNLGILETWTELLVHFSFLKWIWNSAFQCFVPKSSNWMMMGFCWPLWWLPTHTFYTFYTPGRKCLRGGRCRQVLGFAHLLHATFGRPVNSIKNASKRIKLPSLDLPVTSVTVGRHLERRRALCRCSSRSRWSRGRRKAPLPQGEAGRRMAPRWCRCLPDTKSNISISAVIPNHILSIATKMQPYCRWPMLLCNMNKSSATVSIAKSSVWVFSVTNLQQAGVVSQLSFWFLLRL